MQSTLLIKNTEYRVLLDVLCLFVPFGQFAKCPKGTKLLCLLDVLKTSKRHKTFVPSKEKRPKGTKLLCLQKTSKRHKTFVPSKEKRPKGTKLFCLQNKKLLCLLSLPYIKKIGDLKSLAYLTYNSAQVRISIFKQSRRKL